MGLLTIVDNMTTHTPRSSVASKMGFLSVIKPIFTKNRVLMILRHGVEDVERDIGAELENSRPAVSEEYLIVSL